MAGESEDDWAQWLREGRFTGGERDERLRESVHEYRDRILENANLRTDEVVLDVGSGEGLVAFGALDRMNGTGEVILADVSEELLEQSRSIATEAGVLNRCRFVHAPAEDLSPIEDESVDVVTSRSVLVYVDDMERAFSEFYRVLRPGGRFSVFEPVPSFRRAVMRERPHTFEGYDVEPVADLAEKVWDLYEEWAQSPAGEPLLHDERELFSCAEAAGFENVRMEFSAWNTFGESNVAEDWESFLNSAPNPQVPTIGEAMERTLTENERERFTEHLRPLVESETANRESQGATAYLWGVKR